MNNYNKTNLLKNILEKLMNEEDNLTCFDCGNNNNIIIDKKPAHWVSLNNAIYLCLDCSGEHRGLGVGVSYIRSITLDTWNENGVSLMRCGGNKKLRYFLRLYNIPRTIPKKQLYNSKIMHYYRKMVN
jgi:ADP-ribosylation factor GTPase-activating protein 1